MNSSQNSNSNPSAMQSTPTVHQAPTPNELPKFLQSYLVAARKGNRPIVLVTGVFDVLHQEHINFLQKAEKLAKSQSGILVVGLESDRRVRALKGEGRPINQQEVRWQSMQNLHLADVVFILPDQFDRSKDREMIIQLLQPSILAISSHTLHIDKKRQIMQKVGGRVQIIHNHNPAFSSSRIIEQQF